MKSYFRLTKFKLIVTILIIFYVVISIMIASSINSARGETTFSSIFSIPGLVLFIPFGFLVYIFESINVGLPISIVMSFTVEVFIIYTIVCFISYLKYKI